MTITFMALMRGVARNGPGGGKALPFPPPSRRFAGRLALAAVPLLAAGCGYNESRLVHEAQISMIGMTASDLQNCAGPPDKITRLNDRTQVYTYLYKPPSNGAFNLQLPLSLGGVSIGGGGTYCSANLRVVDDRVTELHYTGDEDKTIGEDGVCEPLIRGCMRQPEPSMQPVGGRSYDRSSAFQPPPVPPQPPVSEETAPAPTQPHK